MKKIIVSSLLCINIFAADVEYRESNRSFDSSRGKTPNRERFIRETRSKTPVRTVRTKSEIVHDRQGILLGVEKTLEEHRKSFEENNTHKTSKRLIKSDLAGNAASNLSNELKILKTSWNGLSEDEKKEVAQGFINYFENIKEQANKYKNWDSSQRSVDVWNVNKSLRNENQAFLQDLDNYAKNSIGTMLNDESEPVEFQRTTHATNQSESSSPTDRKDTGSVGGLSSDSESITPTRATPTEDELFELGVESRIPENTKVTLSTSSRPRLDDVQVKNNIEQLIRKFKEHLRHVSENDFDFVKNEVINTTTQIIKNVDSLKIDSKLNRRELKSESLKEVESILRGSVVGPKVISYLEEF